ncbi:hypothetical protein SteCoe_32491 [Stentor coeruleus]|uniref:PIPK domain-containing protein n=1 Tax=Stentor coeruleus TaxID=5963 RepID=A0A1R2AYU9_9CILI|nr:hypothetical protein SteCoe_32491 [Stentor coeruleus]
MLGTLNLSFYIILGILTILLSSFVAFTFSRYHELRQHPSGLLVSLSICEVIMAYHSIIFALDSSRYIKWIKIEQTFDLLGLDSLNSAGFLCGINQILLSASTIACICYNIAICLDLIITLYNPLIPGSVRKKWYHGLTASSVIYFTVYANYENKFIYACTSNRWNRLEIMNSGSVNILLLVYLTIGMTSIIYSACRFANGLKLDSHANKYYLIRHVLYVMIFTLCWTGPAVSYLMRKYGKDDAIGSEVVDSIAIATTSASGFFLGILRLSDPVVWSRVKRLTSFDSSMEKISEDAWTQPVSVIVQGKLNCELTRCIFEGIHSAFIQMKESKQEEDSYFATKKYSTKEIKKIKRDTEAMNVWGVRDSKLNGMILDVYASDIFTNIVNITGFSLDDLIESLNPDNNQNNEVNQSAGKSGSFFLFTRDKKFAIKTIKKKEKQIMMKFLRAYHQHLSEYPKSLLCKIFGIYTLKIPGVTAIYIMLMQNLLYMIKPNSIYDIKGSTKGRTAKKNGVFTSPLKDLDFIANQEHLLLTLDDIDVFKNQLLADVKLLRMNRLMDYSMLIATSDGYENAEKPQHSIYSLNREKVYTMGIIDFLTEYGYMKSIEKNFSTLRYGRLSKGASVANPSRYSGRFVNFILSVVIPIVRRNSSYIIED